MSDRGACEAEMAAATSASADLIAALMAVSAAEAWSADAVRRALAMPGAGGLLATMPGLSRPIGFALYLLVVGECEVLSLGVVPRRRRRGVGRRLLAEVIALAEVSGASRIVLEVARDNLAARTLYRGMDFARVGARPGYYRAGGGGDALILARPIAAADHAAPRPASRRP